MLEAIAVLSKSSVTNPKSGERGKNSVNHFTVGFCS